MNRERDQLDIDGVICASSITVTAKVNQLPGISNKYSPSDIDSWDFFSKDVLRRTGNEELAKRAESYWFDGPTLFAAPREPFALLGILVMSALHYEHHPATSRKESHRVGTLDWLDSRYPKLIRHENVHFRNGSCSGNELKAEIHDKIKPVLIFEDNGDTIKYFLYHGIDPHKIVMIDRPWNRSFKEYDKLRVENWLHAVPRILTATVK